MTLTPEAVYMRLGQLVAEMPELAKPSMPPETQLWLGRVVALIEEMGATGISDAIEIKFATRDLDSPHPGLRRSAADKITQALYRSLARAEIAAPATVQGAFVAAGDVHDAFAIVGKVLAEANSDLLIVDPYANEVLLQDFVVIAPENAVVRILTTPQYKAALQPAVERWRKQYGKGRPLEVRISGPKLLHDRLIIVDQTTAWSLTQSFKDLAARSPTSIIRTPPDMAQAKIEAYTDLWSNAQAL